MSSTTTALYEKIINVANTIIDGSSEPLLSKPQGWQDDAIAISPFASPKDLTPRLVELGLPHDVAESMSQAFLKNANDLKARTESILRSTLMSLATVPHSRATMPSKQIQRKICDVHQRAYRTTIASWMQEAESLVHSRLTLVSTISYNPFPDQGPRSGKKSRRQFKSEYLPLFEFAFEKDRFPSREDKKHLARISGMSFRQVNVWFQNRRCRQPSRATSQRTITGPRTFEELKARLCPSARAALSESTSLTKKLNPDFADPPTGAPVLMQNPSRSMQARDVVVLDDVVTLPVASPRGVSLEATEVVTSGSSSRAVSLEATEAATTPGSTTRAVSLGATDDGFASDEDDDSSEEDVSTTSRPAPSAIAKLRPSPPQKPDPLNPFRTSVHAFPTPYAPSQLTADPFVIEHHPWLRDPCTKSKKYIEPTPEAMEEILGGFNHVDIALL